MGIMDNAKKLTKDKAKIAGGVDKATDLVDKATKGKFHDKLEKVDEAAAKIGKKKA